MKTTVPVGEREREREGEREGGKRSIGGGGDKLTCNYQTNRARLFVSRVGTCFMSEKKLLENAIIHYLSLSNLAIKPGGL